MKESSLLYLLLSGILLTGVYFIGKSHGEKIVHGPTIEIPALPSDTSPKEVTVTIVRKDTALAHSLRKKYDSLAAVIAAERAEEEGDEDWSEEDNTFELYNNPWQAQIDDELSTNYVTVFPLEPIMHRLLLDSTAYKSRIYPLAPKDCEQYSSPWYDAAWVGASALLIIEIVLALLFGAF